MVSLSASFLFDFGMGSVRLPVLTLKSFADPDDPYKLTDETRQLGLIVCRGTAVTLVCPCEGMAEIANPFGESAA